MAICGFIERYDADERDDGWDCTMARAQLRDSWTTTISIDAARQKLAVFFTNHRMSVVQGTETTVELKQGSQLTTRLLGGWFVDPSNFPKRAEIRLSSSEHGLRIEAMIEEALSFGVLDSHFKSRYENYFQVWMNALKNELLP